LHAADRLAVVRPWAPLLAVAALPVAAAVLAEFWRARRRTLLLLVWIGVPVAALAFLAWRNVKPWNVRYLAVVLPWVLILVARGTERLPRRGGVLAAALLCALAMVAVGGHHFLDRYAKEDVRGAAARVLADDRAADPVLVPVVTNVYRYYDRRPTGILDSYGVEPLRDAAAADRFVSARLAGQPRAWVVLSRPWFFDPRGLLVPALRRAGRVTEEASLVGVRLLHWTGPPPDRGVP
jgi:hypothetical protein